MRPMHSRIQRWRAALRLGTRPSVAAFLRSRCPPCARSLAASRTREATGHSLALAHRTLERRPPLTRTAHACAAAGTRSAASNSCTHWNGGQLDPAVSRSSQIAEEEKSLCASSDDSRTTTGDTSRPSSRRARTLWLSLIALASGVPLDPAPERRRTRLATRTAAATGHRLGSEQLLNTGSQADTHAQQRQQIEWNGCWLEHSHSTDLSCISKTAMALSPQHVVSTFSRQLCAQPDAMPFIHSIQYEESGAERRIRLRFWATNDALHTIDLHVAKHDAAAVFVCQRIDCSFAVLQPSLQQLLQSSSLSNSSSAFLFRLVESVVCLLRDQLPRPAPAARRFAAAFLRSHPPTAVLSKSLAFDAYLTLLGSAAHSGRSCTLVNPVPPSCRSMTGAEGEQDAALVRLQTALQQMPPMVPLCVRTALSQHDDSAASVPAAALSLLNDAARMVDLMNLRCIDEQLHSASSAAASSSPASVSASSPRRPWFQYDNDGGSNLSCPAPHWVLDVALHEPHFDELVSTHAATASATSASAPSQLLQVYHGSPLENWHSILHRGLQNHSGTKHQSSGALFGDGVYFSDDLRVARNFSKAGRNPMHGEKDAASAAAASSMLGARVEVVGVYDLLIPPVTAIAASSPSIDASPPPVRRAPPRELSGADDVPDNYFVVSDMRYARLKHLLLWRADGLQPGRISMGGGTESVAKAMHTGAVPAAGLPRMIVAQQSPAPSAPMSLADRLLRCLRALFSGPGMIVAYALVLLAIGLAQVDWHRTRRIVAHWWRVQAGKRF